MPIPELRVAAAQFVLNILDLGELPALLERLVDHDFITPAVADLYTGKPISPWHYEKLIQLFRQQCIALPSEEQARWTCLHHRVRGLIEQTVPVGTTLRSIADMRWTDSYERFDIDPLIRLYWSYDDDWEEGENRSAHVERRLAPEAIGLARDWHQRHGPVIDPTWLRPVVLQLAQAIHAERAFDRLPVLADVLEEVGCMDTDILEHCRFPNVHPQGCWVIDLLLGAS